MFPSSSTTSHVTVHSLAQTPAQTQTPPPSPPRASPPKRAAQSVKKLVKGFKRRISLFGHHHRRSSGDQSFSSSASDDVNSDTAPPELSAHDGLAVPPEHSPYLPLTIPLPPSPSSSRTRGHFSDASSQLSAPFSDSHTYAGTEDSTLLSEKLPSKDQPEVDEQVIPPPVPAAEPVVMEVSPEPEAALEEQAAEEYPEVTEQVEESESHVAEDLSTSEVVEDQGTLISPPVLEPEVPDPFLVDDPDDAVSEEEEEEQSESLPVDDEDNDSTPADEIALAQSVAELPPPTTPASALTSTDAHPLSSPLHVNKPVPPAPTSEAAAPTSDASSSSEEDEPPTLYISGLTVPTMFLPIPNVRISICYPLTWWLRPRSTLLTAVLVRSC